MGQAQVRLSVSSSLIVQTTNCELDNRINREHPFLLAIDVKSAPSQWCD